MWIEHVAGTCFSMVQRCTRCGAVLVDMRGTMTMGSGGGWKVGSRVYESVTGESYTGQLNGNATAVMCADP